ncbi:MAG: DUF2125 domain-containing protein [Silicimonas sp.]|nr:DUF2125 domain-containing protein [Silicimonas sp.]
MTLTRTLTSTSILALMAGPALADLTAEDVLADQLNQMSMYGIDVETTGQSRSGDTLTVDGLAITAEIPEGSFTMTVGGAQFTEQGDGTVVMSYPAEIPITVSGEGPEGERFEMAAMVRQTGTQSVVSGTPEQIKYEFTSDSMTVGDLEFLAPADAAEVDMDVVVEMTGMSGTMEMDSGTVRSYDVDMVVKALTMAVRAQEPGSDEVISFNFDVADLAAEYVGQLARQNLMDSFAKSIENGNRTKGSGSHGALNYTFSGDGPDGSFQGSAQIASGDLVFSMDENGLDYGGTSREMTMTMGGSAIPFPPMSFAMAESGGRFAIPLVPGEDPQNFTLKMSMIGLEVDPALWGMIDPAQQLPRDPANIVIDLDGEVVLSEDIFDPEFAEQAMMAPPGQINELNVNEIRVSIAGAELTGDGDFTFNNEMGMPLPSGVMNMMLTGGNGLLDTLVGMGLVPEEQAMGARMMMGLFARPGDGEDTLVSTIEVKEDGSVLANGQRIK